MSLPLVVSPYLRPFVAKGELVYDNGITGQVSELSPIEAQVVRAMWVAATGRTALEAVVADVGDDAVATALANLVARQMLFDSAEAANAAFDATLDDQLRAVPFLDQIELTNICPMRCGFCPRGIPGKMKRPTGRMDLELFRRLLAQAHPEQARYRPLELHHLGESLVHPDVDSFVRVASEHGLPSEMSVNPSLLTPALGRRLVDAGLRRIIVSMDAMDDATFVAIRGPAATYTKAEPNLAALLDYIAGLQSPPTVVIQMIDLHKNRHQREAFLERWGNSGLPTVHAFVKDLDGPDPDTNETSATPLTYLCSYPWRSVAVLWDGRVVPCCRDDDGQYVLGDLKEQSLEQIWHGTAATALRDAHRSQCVPQGHLCSGCSWSREAFVAAMPRRHPDDAVANPLQW